MENIHVLAVGDVTGPAALKYLEKTLPALKAERHVDFCVVNGENTDSIGLTNAQAQALLAAGADVITMGNHTWSRPEIVDTMATSPAILRPANYPPQLPGRGVGVYDTPCGPIAVIDLIGRSTMDMTCSNPFLAVESILSGLDTKLICVELHAENTGEKQSMAWMLDGRVSALWGTHTHVPTADAHVLPQGTGYITDLGATGAVWSVQGFRPDIAIERHRGSLPRLYEPGQGEMRLNGCLFTLDPVTGKCLAAQRVEA